MKLITPKKIHKDDRGSIEELKANGLLLTTVLCLKGSIRGGHYHKKHKEIFVLMNGLIRISIGPVEKKISKRIITMMSVGQTMVIDPYEIHTITALRDSTLLKIIMPGETRDGDTFNA